MSFMEGFTCIHDEEILLLVLGDMADSCEEESSDRVLTVKAFPV